MTVEITPVFAAQLARNHCLVPGSPEARLSPTYGVSASLKGRVIDLALSFKSGSAYCCHELGCHMGLFDGKWWDRLRRELAARGIDVPDPLELRLAITVESGAMFFDWSRPEPSPSGRGWYSFTPAEMTRYEEVVAEPGRPSLSRHLESKITEVIESAIRPLVGLPLWAVGHAATLTWFQFGGPKSVSGVRGRSKEVGEFALHTECSWRLVNDAGDNLACNESCDDSLTRLGNRRLVCSGASATGDGGLELCFVDGWTLFVEKGDPDDLEYWRLFQPGTEMKHFVVGPFGIED